MNKWKYILPTTALLLLAGKAVAQDDDDERIVIEGDAVWVEENRERNAEVERQLYEAERRMNEAARQIHELTVERLPGAPGLQRRIEIISDDKPRLGVTIGNDAKGAVKGVAIVGVTPGSDALYVYLVEDAYRAVFEAPAQVLLRSEHEVLVLTPGESPRLTPEANEELRGLKQPVRIGWEPVSFVRRAPGRRLSPAGSWNARNRRNVHASSDARRSRLLIVRPKTSCSESALPSRRCARTNARQLSRVFGSGGGTLYRTFPELSEEL